MGAKGEAFDGPVGECMGVGFGTWADIGVGVGVDIVVDVGAVMGLEGWAWGLFQDSVMRTRSYA